MTSDVAELESLVEVSTQLDRWIESQEFQGWDPFDALRSPLLRRLTFNSRRLGMVWVQLLKHSPLNLRPILGVAKGRNPMGMGLFLASYVRKYLWSGSDLDARRAQEFGQWLDDNQSPGYAGACWGYDFDWPNRGFFAPAGTPTIVNTGLNALALLDSGPGSTILLDRAFCAGMGPSGPAVFQKGLNLARSACDFVTNSLNVTRPRHDELCFSYTPLDERYVHNANLFGAWLLAEVSRHTGETALARSALAAARYTARRQRENGSWPYGEGRSDAWIDNFHTGFVLVALRRIGLCLGTDEFQMAVEKGYSFWKANLFTSDHAPKYYADALYPIDVHSVAQAALTFVEFSKTDENGLNAAFQVLQWGARHMRDQRGFFHYRKTRAWTIRIPYMRWGQAWMQRALAEFLAVSSAQPLRRVVENEGLEYA